MNVRATRYLCAVLIVAPLTPVSGQPDRAGWQEYRNVRFGTSAAFPAKMFHLRDKSDNGDGATFVTNDGAQLKIFGSYNVLDQSPSDFAAFVTSDRTRYARVTYRAVRRNWIVLSGTRQNSTFYERYEFENGRNIIHAVIVQYPSHMAKKYDAVATQVAGSLHW